MTLTLTLTPTLTLTLTRILTVTTPRLWLYGATATQPMLYQELRVLVLRLLLVLVVVLVLQACRLQCIRSRMRVETRKPARSHPPLLLSQSGDREKHWVYNSELVVYKLRTVLAQY